MPTVVASSDLTLLYMLLNAVYKCNEVFCEMGALSQFVFKVFEGFSFCISGYSVGLN